MHYTNKNSNTSLLLKKFIIGIIPISCFILISLVFSTPSAEAAITWGTENQFNNITSYISVAKLTSTKFVVAYRDGSASNVGNSIIGTINPSDNSINYGSETTFETDSPSYISVARLSDSQFVVSYRPNTSPNYGQAKIGTVSGTSITYSSSAYTYSSSSVLQNSVSGLDETNKTFVVNYRYGAIKGTARIGTYSGTGAGASITWSSSEYDFNPASASEVSTARLADDQFVVVYKDAGASSTGNSRVGTVSGTGSGASITWSSSEYNFNNSNSINMVSAAGISSSQLVVAYEDSADSSKGHARVGTVSGTGSGASITYSTSEYAFNPDGTSWLSASPMTGSDFVVAYWDSGNSQYGTARVGTVFDSGASASISYISGESVYNSNTSTYNSVAGMDIYHFVVGYNGSGKARVGEEEGAGPGPEIPELPKSNLWKILLAILALGLVIGITTWRARKKSQK